jgi:chaperonin GroES
MSSIISDFLKNFFQACLTLMSWSKQLHKPATEAHNIIEQNKLTPESFIMADKTEEVFETVEPVGKRVLIRKDEDKKQTKGGIQLPDNIEIPTITGRIVAISAEIESMPEIPLQKYDKVLFNPKGAIPVDFEGDNRLFVVEVENVVAVFRKA